jgi:hypothetical protein
VLDVGCGINECNACEEKVRKIEEIELQVFIVVARSTSADGRRAGAEQPTTNKAESEIALRGH